MAALAVTGPLPVFLTRSVKPLKLAGAAGIALAVNVALVILLVPPLGATGAALVSLAGYWLYAERLFALMRRHHGIGVREMIARPHPGDAGLSILGRVRR